MMSHISPKNHEKDEFEIWERMKAWGDDRLLDELRSSCELNRFTAAKELHLRGGSNVFISAMDLLKSDSADSREVSAFTLGQLGTPGRPFADKSMPALLNVLEHDPSPKVRAASAASLGHLGLPQAVPFLVRAINDENDDVRRNVAFALGKIGGEVVARPLLELTHDHDADVVEWAIIGLRLLDDRSPLLLDRLLDLAVDPREGISDESICGLAERQEARVFPVLLAALNRECINIDLIEAAAKLGDARILPRLYELRETWRDDPPRELLAAIQEIEGVHRRRPD